MRAVYSYMMLVVANDGVARALRASAGRKHPSGSVKAKECPDR
jgi:hypothetical protein